MIEKIGDPDDPRISEYAHVGDPAWLRERGLFVGEGRLVVQRLLVSRRFIVRSILLTPAALRALSIDEQVRAFVAEPRILNAITGFNFHRGCLALAERLPGGDTDALFGAKRILALEAVGNPDNVGGLFRVAAAFGVDGVLLDPSSGDPLYRKAIRTSVGASLAVPFSRAASWPAPVSALRSEGFSILALTPRREALPIADVATTRRARFVLLVGAEGAGLSSGAMELADLPVRIPMAPGVDSLNVVVAAGIALSHLA